VRAFVVFVAVSGCGRLRFEATGDAENCSNTNTNTIDCVRTVFVTSEQITGNFGGASAADAICTTAATASPLASVQGRSYLAWLSDGFTAPIAWLHGTAAYQRPDGIAIASNWSDLVDGKLAAPISIDELGDAVSAGQTWSDVNTNADAETAGNCQAWTTNTNGKLGGIGGNGDVSSMWTAAGTQDCSLSAHLYCFEL
jgi:hypothetical protein